MLGARRGGSLVAALAVLIAAGRVGAQSAGDAPVAARYVDWALAATAEGRWSDAETALERGLDFADESSDAAYLLAVARLRLDRPIGSVLAAVRLALATGRWQRYGAAAGRLLEAEALLAVRDFGAALDALAGAPPSADAAYAEARALAGLGDLDRYCAAVREDLAAYPADPRFARLVLDQASRRAAAAPPESALVRSVLDRLAFFLPIAPDLAYRAVPFLPDPAGRSRLVAAYRAAGGADPAGLLAALELGLVGGAQAVLEFFAAPSGFDGPDAVLDLGSLRRLWSLLRNDADRAVMAAAAENYAGWVESDADDDGRRETRCRYAGAVLVRCEYDADQDGLPEIAADFMDGRPYRAEVATFAPEAPADPAAPVGRLGEDGLPARLAAAAERSLCIVEWERYPFVALAQLDGTAYIPAPDGFPYAPLIFEGLATGAGAPRLFFAQAAFVDLRLTPRALWSFASAIERPGTQAVGSVERIELVDGTPRSAVETLDGRTIALRQYSAGRLASARLDLDADGRMESSLRYRASVDLDSPAAVEYRESDWDGDGRAEYAERLLPDGRIEQSWDQDGDGRRERISLAP